MPTRREARTSVLPEGQNLGAGGIQFRRASKNRRGPPGRRAVLGRFPPRAMTTRLPMNSTSFKIRKVKRRGAGGRKGHPCLCARAEKDGARPQNTGIPVFAGGPERLGGGNS